VSCFGPAALGPSLGSGWRRSELSKVGLVLPESVSEAAEEEAAAGVGAAGVSSGVNGLA